MSVVPLDAPERARQGQEYRSVGSRVRRVGLVIFFVSIAVNAALGIYAVLAPGFGATQSKILATSIFVTGTILVALACEPAWERGMLTPVPYAGTVLGLCGFTLATVGMWSEMDNDLYGKVMGTIFVAAAACTAASLLALARLADRHRWVFVVTLTLLALGASMFGLLLWLGDDPPDAYARAMGVVLIALAAFVVTVPVLHWIDRAALTTTNAGSVVHFCPYCGDALAGESGIPLTCGTCSTAFVVNARQSAD